MSFISVEPQPRAVLESHSTSLLAQFDKRLGIIADRYLAFFQERRNIEATYIDSLRKLYRKAKTADASFDPRDEPATTRAAWDIVRDNLERETSAQQTFVDVLENYVIKPLRTLKESNDETRMRIAEDLNESTAKYADHAENKISNLQQAYLKKYHPQQCAHSAEALQRPEDVRNKKFGGKVSALFRGRREDSRECEATKSDEVSDDDCRLAVGRLNSLRLMRAESLGDGYDCLEELVFMPTVKDALVKYTDSMVSACAMSDDLAKNARAEVAKALAGNDTSDLRASFHRTLSFSIPPLTLYRNCRPGAYSDLIFGVPMVDVETNEDNVPKVIRMCIDEVEKRGLYTKGIYSVGHSLDAEVLQLRRRIECERSFLFNPTDNIHSVAMLLKRYLWDLPEPLLALSLQDYRAYRSNRAIYTDQLRSRICELHPVHRASLEALLRHLLLVASHLDKNEMTVEALATEFRYVILRGSKVRDAVNAKKLVMEDLIQNAHTLFDELPSPSHPVSSFNAAETTTLSTYGSLFLSPELPQPAGVQAMGYGTLHRPERVLPTSTQSSISLPSDSATESRLTPSPTPLLSPLLGLPSSTERVEMTTQEELIPKTRGPKALETLADRTSAEVLSVPLTSVAASEWRLRQSRLPPPPDVLLIPQSPPESARSSMSDFPLSSATSLQTRMGPFSP
ncbi:hypothetical protein EI94DRAFT_589570 [Lactarius quietus]|nr:hypothetical protein EI94DRAFT_1048520 [Lactarius quietus]KAF8263424.1 hypothetical protein EI94DRAFT_589570 [Lactarius quietus]